MSLLCTYRVQSLCSEEPAVSGPDPPDTREEERERRREANKDDHTMERLEDTVCVCSHLEHISVVFMLIKVLTYSFFIISC